MEILKYIQVSSQSATNICYLFNFKHAILKINQIKPFAYLFLLSGALLSPPSMILVVRSIPHSCNLKELHFKISSVKLSVEDLTM